ncbi:MAG: hypothetical protein RR348_01140 [Clostridia bacterium]
MKKNVFIIDTATARMNFVFAKLSAIGANCKKYDSNLILPKISPDNQQLIYVFSPTYKVNQDVLNTLPYDAIVFCGKLFFDHASTQPTQKIVSYFQDTEFVKINSKITAEGALQLSIANTSLSLFDSNILILGYGNLAKQLAIEFAPHAKKLAIATYSKKELQEAITQYTTYFCTAFLQSLATFDIVVNTIPAVVINEKATFKPDSFLLDLASTSCLQDNYIPQGVTCLQALGLPDKTSPQSAGNYIANFVMDSLKTFEKQATQIVCVNNNCDITEQLPDEISQDEITFLLT